MAAPKKTIDLAAIDEHAEFSFRSAESQEDRVSRLKREEAEHDHKLRMEEKKQGHDRWINGMAHVFVVAVLSLGFLGCSYLTLTGDPQSPVTQTATTILTGIVTGGVGFLFGKAAK